MVKGVVNYFATITLLDLDLTEHTEKPRRWRDLPRADETPRGKYRPTGRSGCRNRFRQTLSALTSARAVVRTARKGTWPAVHRSQPQALLHVADRDGNGDARGGAQPLGGGPAIQEAWGK